MEMRVTNSSAPLLVGTAHPTIDAKTPARCIGSSQSSIGDGSGKGKRPPAWISRKRGAILKRTAIQKWYSGYLPRTGRLRAAFAGAIIRVIPSSSEENCCDSSSSRVLCGIAGLVSVASQSFGADLPYVQHENVIYADVYGVALVMDVFTPTGKAERAGESSTWRAARGIPTRGKINDHKRAQMYDIFCRKGYTVFAVRPGSITKFTVPEMLANLKTGIRWVKQHAAEYKIDPADRPHRSIGGRAPRVSGGGHARRGRWQASPAPTSKRGGLLSADRFP